MVLLSALVHSNMSQSPGICMSQSMLTLSGEEADTKARLVEGGKGKRNIKGNNEGAEGGKIRHKAGTRRAAAKGDQMKGVGELVLVVWNLRKRLKR